MRSEIVSIGSELTSGQSLDTNGAWISRRLAEVGVHVGFHTTVEDDLQANIDVFRAAVGRADLVIATGGLGPTADDLTRDVLASLAGVELVLHEESLEIIRTMFSSRNRTMPERNRVQAMFPAGATVIPNPRGTAPGIWMEIGKSVVVAMPGVPREMYSMFDEWVLPRIRERFSTGKVLCHRTLRCFGAGESHIEEKLGDLTKRGRTPEVGITASSATISLRITTTGRDLAEAQAAAEPDAKFIYEQLGEVVFGEGDVELQDVVARLLLERHATLSTAESCTGGLVGHLLTEIAGISEVYLGGVVSYSNEAKKKFLGVPESILKEHGAVSAQTAEAMADGCRERFGSDLAVAVTGIAGPGGGSLEKPVGLVYVSLAHEKGHRTVKLLWGADRSFTKILSAKTALNLVRLHLLLGPGNY